MDSWTTMTALQLGKGIAAGKIDPVALTETFLEAIAAKDRDKRVYITVMAARARQQAKAAQQRQRDGSRLGPLDGVPFCWKDLCDTKGTLTTFGSAVFKDRIPDRDCALLQRATAAGTIILGKTNLSEFAYSGLGINPTYGTPPSALDQNIDRVPGGSSSGTGVAVASGLAAAGIGSDTGGSVRIPAAFNGLVGLKTTAGALPMEGMMALSPTLDTIGPLTRDVADANAFYALLRQQPAADLANPSAKFLHILVPENIVTEDLDSEVADAFEKSLQALAGAGVQITRQALPLLDKTAETVALYGNIISTEGMALWRDVIAENEAVIYHQIVKRFRAADSFSAADAERAHLRFADQAQQYRQIAAGYDALVWPTVPILPPPIAELEADDAAFDRANIASARNTRFGNLYATSAISLPVGQNKPIGLMVMGLPHEESRLLRVAAAFEPLLHDID